MTYEEAIKEIQQIPKHIGGDCDGYELKALRTAIEALKKQIPKKPHPNYSKLSDVWCECGAYLGKPMVCKESMRYCQWCGQAIDWSDKE